MKGLLLLISFLFFQSLAYGQTVSLPVHFESGSVVTSDFTNFDGGTAMVVPNPFPTGINTSSTVGVMVRNGGQVWAGAYLTTASNVNFSVNPIICMKVYTTAPIGTKISLKMEGCGGGCFSEVDAFTTVSGEWETLCYDYTGQPANFNRLVFLFDLGSVGNGTSSSTFLFDDIEQLQTLPLFFTPGSQFFCPNSSLTFTYPGPGTYNWYADPSGNTLLQAGNSTYTTPILTAAASFYVQDMTPTPLPLTAVGPSIPGGTAIGNSFTTSTFFRSNLDNGLFHSVDIVLHIPTGPVPLNTCTYKVDIFNITQGTSRTLTQGFVSPVNFTQHTYLFGTPLPIFLNDQLEMRITSITAHPCYCSSSSSGNNGLFIPFPNSYDPPVTFNGHTSNGVSNTYMSGLNYTVSGDLIDPTLYQVNALVDCAVPLPVELLDFSVRENDGDALLTWTTATELNNDKFLVMRTVDGLEYKTIGSVKGAGNSSSLLQYSFRDSLPELGLSYYQLKQVDFNGTETLSQLVPFEIANSNEFIVYPNPTLGDITIDLGTSYSNISVRLKNTLGQIVQSENYPSSSRMEFFIEGERGVYFLEIFSENKKTVLKVVKE